jgi:hypothetical protein
VSALIGRALSLVGIAFALIWIFVLEGISIEIPGIILGGGATTSGSAMGISAVILCVISIIISGLAAPQQ